MRNRQRRVKQKASKKISRGRVPKGKNLAPRTANEYFSQSERFRDRWTRVTHVISKMRKDRVSLRQASREFGLSPWTVIRWAGSALRKRANGQYAAKASDRLLRVLVILTRQGLQEIATMDSRQATLLGQYWTAVERYRNTGDASALREFRGKHIIDATGKRIPLMTNRRALDHLGSAGVLSFETMYAKAA